MPPTFRPRSRWRTALRSSRRPSFSPPPARLSPKPRARQTNQPKRHAMNAEKLRMLFDLTGRTAIITGGTRGIGFALARGYFAGGDKLVVRGRTEDRCRAARSQLEVDTSGRVAAIAAHMGDLDQVKNLVQQTVLTFNGIDI